MIRINIPKTGSGSYECVIKTELAINHLFKEVLGIPYRFFMDADTDNKEIYFIKLSDFEILENINTIPSINKETGQSKTAYHWSDKGFSASLIIEEIWKFEATPKNRREVLGSGYSMPEKILLKDLTTFHFVFAPEFEIKLIVDKKTSSLELNALGHQAADINHFFEAIFK
jgi:hypothetical protein